MERAYNIAYLEDAMSAVGAMLDYSVNACGEDLASFKAQVSPLEYVQALGISLKNMAGMDSDILREVSPIVDMLNLMQTTIGILLTGIFGFILGNKIRNQ